MSKAKILSAAVLAGMTSTAAQAAQSADDHLIAVAPGPADEMLITHEFERDGDIPVAPSAVHVGDDLEIRIDYAQTYWGGESSDAVQGVTNPGKKQKPNKGITLDNGIKKKGKVKPQQAGAKKKKKN